MRSAFNRVGDQYLVLGCVAMLLSVAGLLAIRTTPGLVSRYGSPTIGLLLVQTASGIALAVWGVSRKLKTFDVAGEAEPLCEEHGQTAAGGSARKWSYRSSDLKTFLKACNLPIYPPRDYFDRLLYEFFPDALSCSPVLQSVAREYFLRAVTAAIVFCLFLLTLLSAFLGMYANHENSTVKWIALMWFYFLFANSFCAHVIARREITPWRLVAFICCAIFLSTVVPLIAPWQPKISNWIFWCLAMSTALPAVELLAFFTFLRSRLKSVNAYSHVTTSTIRIQGPLAPDAIYQHFVSAFNCEARSINRCYQDERNDSPTPGTSGSGRTGTISGEILLESDPLFAGSAAVATNHWGWVGVAISLAGLLTLYGSVAPSVMSVSLLVASLMMVNYGRRFLGTVEFFLMECLFQSSLVYFKLEGTYDTAKLGTAAGGQVKQLKSLNIDVSITVRCVDLVSSVFAKPGAALPFRGAPRHILAFGETPRFAYSILQEFVSKISMQNSLEPIRVSPALPHGNPGVLTNLELYVPGRRLILCQGARFTSSDLQGLATPTGIGIVAEVIPHPRDRAASGLRNLSTQNWSVCTPTNVVSIVAPGQTFRLERGLRVAFGVVDGEIQ